MAIWAYIVVPGRGSAAQLDPEGGRMDSSAVLERALADSTRRVKAEAWGEVVFRPVDIPGEDGSTRRSCESRDLVMDIAFRTDETQADRAAMNLARRLSISMDTRSPLAHLFVASSILVGSRGETRLWAFPQDDAFRFSVRERPTIELLDQVFSRVSRLRKAARFDGENNQSDFLFGQVLDQQAGSRPTEVAQYWVDRFLDCDFRVTAGQGTQMAARALQAAIERQDDPERRRELGVIAAFIPQAPPRRRSLEDIVDDIVPAHLRQDVLMASPYPHLNAQPFDLEPELFRELIGSTVFRMEHGVVVTSPMSQVDRGDGLDRPVRVRGDQLTLEGRIVQEKYRAGRAQPG